MKKKNKPLKTLHLAKETIVCLSGSSLYEIIDTTIGDQLSTLPACVDTTSITT